MAFVHDPKDNLTILGVVTLEDIIEELIDSEIYDETDIIVPDRPEYSAFTDETSSKG
jgi:CBS domain containing-hemolysin-like protein